MFWPTYSITISSAAMGSMANRPQSWMCDLQNRILFLRNYRKTKQTRTSSRSAANIGATASVGFLPDCASLYLQLVELQQVAVAGERGQQAALLRAALRSGPGGGVDLRRDAHALQEGDERVWARPSPSSPPCPSPHLAVGRSAGVAAHLRVDRRLLRQQPGALQVLDLVLLVDLVVAFTARAAGGVIPHAVVPPLLLHAGDVGRCSGGVKEETQKDLQAAANRKKKKQFALFTSRGSCSLRKALSKA